MAKKEADLLKELKTKFKWWELCKTIVWWGRLNSGKFQTIHHTWVQGFPKGTPDFVTFVRDKNGGGSLIFFECKADGGKLRPDQIAFIKKYHNNDNIYCYEVTSVDEVSAYIKQHAEDPTQQILWDN